MVRNVQTVVGTTAAMLAIGGGATEALGAESAADLSVVLSSRQPASSTGIDFRVFYRDPEDPEGKPSPIESLVIEGPAGLRFDGDAVPACQATDEQFRAMGRNACPEASKVGEGTLTAITGFAAADPFEGDVTVFNGGDQLIELVTVKGSNATAGLDRLTIDGSTLTGHPPNTPGGPPDGRTSVREVRFHIPARESGTGAERRAFVTTPPTCPPDRAWTFRGRFGFANGTDAAVTSTTPCDARPGRPSARIFVTPRTVRAGQRTRFDVRVKSASDRCRGGVALRLGAGRAVSSSEGRATIVTRLWKPGLRRVRFTAAGCTIRSASVMVRPRSGPRQTTRT